MIFGLDNAVPIIAAALALLLAVGYWPAYRYRSDTPSARALRKIAREHLENGK